MHLAAPNVHLQLRRDVAAAVSGASERREAGADGGHQGRDGAYHQEEDLRRHR